MELILTTEQFRELDKLITCSRPAMATADRGELELPDHTGTAKIEWDQDAVKFTLIH